MVSEESIGKLPDNKKANKSPNLIKKMMKNPRVIEKIMNYQDICDVLNIHPIESLPYPKPTTEKQVFMNATFKLTNISEVFNEGWIRDYEKGERGWYAYFIWDKVSSGFVFNATYYHDSSATAGSASRLCFETEEKARCVGKRFLAEINEFLNPKVIK